MSDNGETHGRKGGFDLDRMSVPELAALRDAAEAKRMEKLDAARDAVLAETRAKLAELGLSLESALRTGAGQGTGGQAKRTRKESGSKLPAKYKGPNGEEWTGRGRLPKWLQVAEAEGKSREEFKI